LKKPKYNISSPYRKLTPRLTKLASAPMMDTTRYSILPPRTPNHIPKLDAIAIITPVIKYGEVRYSSIAYSRHPQIKGKKATIVSQIPLITAPRAPQPQMATIMAAQMPILTIFF